MSAPEVPFPRALHSVERASIIGRLLILALVACPLFPFISLAEAGSGVEALRDWESRYRQRKIVFYEPYRGIPGSTPRFYDREAVAELDRVFGVAAAENTIEAAEALVDVATFYFTREPHREYTRSQRIGVHRPEWVRDRAIDALAAMKSGEVRGWIVDELLSDTRGARSEFRREVAARVLDRLQYEPAMYALRMRLRDRDPRVRVAALEALDSIGGTGSLPLVIPSLSDPAAEVRSVAAEILRFRARQLRTLGEAPSVGGLAFRLSELLKDESWWVRLSAAEALRETRNRAAIGPLIEALRNERSRRVRDANPRVHDAIYRSLVSLTGKGIPADDVAAWSRWWSGAGESFEVYVPKKTSRQYAPSFYGVTLRSTRILFVLDLSSSMDYPASGGRYANGVETKLDQVKRELVKTLSMLEARTKFDILFFSDGTRRFAGELVEATPEKIEQAKFFVMQQRAGGGTNLYGTLEKALGFGEPGRAEKEVGFEVDAIIMLSDGWPSTGEFIEPEEVVRWVSDANRHARTQIHTIAIDGQLAPDVHTSLPVPFMEELARRNHGQFRKIELR